MPRIIVLVLFTTVQAFGCVCAGFFTPKQLWQASSFVFVGQVENASPEFDLRNPFRAQRVTVRVEEAFKGVQRGQVIEIEQTGSDCELKYSKGWRRLLYLKEPKEGRWFSPGCDRSNDPNSAADDLRFLRALPLSSNRTRISGEVVLSGNPRRVMPGVKVTITSAAGRPVTTVTDQDGVFEAYDLPKGTYSVSVDIPRGFKANFGFVSGPRRFSDEFPLTITLGDTHATAAFYLEPTRGK